MPLSRAIGRFNRVATNRLTRLIAGRLPGFGIITHRGRRSGRTYRTPVNVFRRPRGFVVALTYGRGDWVKNVLAAGQAQVRAPPQPGYLASPRLASAAAALMPRRSSFANWSRSVIEPLFG